MKTIPIVLALAFLVSLAAPLLFGQTGQAGSQNTPARQTGKAPPGFPVSPGDPCHTNNDGVRVCNTGTMGDIVINPKHGSANSATTVVCKSNAQGDVTGIDVNDTVEVTFDCNVTITGTGGTVDVSGSNGHATVTNSGQAGGGNITATGPGGTTVTIPPGNTVTVSS